MPEFIFMLTRNDVTVEDAFEVYDEVRDAGLRYVGFKDVGLPFDRLRALTQAMHEGGQEVMLEVVSEEREDELRSARAALDLGVDYLLGGTHAEEVTEMLSGTGIRYCPFPGRIIGHPSLLRGSIEEITQSAGRLAAMDGVRGLDLLAYRHDGDVERLVRSVVESVEVPVIAAGSVDSEEKIRTLADAGVWGFTVGSAIFEGKFAYNGASTREQVETVLAASRPVAS
jgi:Histidine biosynthesis protein